MHDDTVIIICSRPKSVRLPGKIFKKIAGVPVIEHINTRLKETGIKIIWAIPPQTVGQYGFYVGIKNIYLGNPASPLHRMADYIRESHHKWVIRVTHDDILIDSSTLLKLLAEVKRYDADYGYSPKILEGSGVEIIKSENLLRAARERKEPTEFVSYFVRRGKQIQFNPRTEILRDYRLTLDYYEDYVLLETILRELGPWATCDQICALLDASGHLLGINKLPDVSVYTCVKDGSRWIRDAMISVLSQDVKMEYIIIDDYSKDDTLIQIAKTQDPRIDLILNPENVGLASSSNIAITKAKGKYLLRLDADDVLMPGAIKEMMLYGQGKAVVYPGYREIKENGESTRILVSPQENHHAGCALMERSAVNEIKFKDGLRNWDGLDLYNKMKSHDFPIGYIDRALWFYRKRADSMSKSSRERDKDRGRIAQ